MEGNEPEKGEEITNDVQPSERGSDRAADYVKGINVIGTSLKHMVTPL